MATAKTPTNKDNSDLIASFMEYNGEDLDEIAADQPELYSAIIAVCGNLSEKFGGAPLPERKIAPKKVAEQTGASTSGTPKFKVGDIIIGNDINTYAFTGEGTMNEVVKVNKAADGSQRLNIKLLKSASSDKNREGSIFAGRIGKMFRLATDGEKNLAPIAHNPMPANTSEPVFQKGDTITGNEKNNYNITGKGCLIEFVGFDNTRGSNFTGILRKKMSDDASGTTGKMYASLETSFFRKALKFEIEAWTKSSIIGSGKKTKPSKLTRPSPTQSATSVAEGTYMRGNDGRQYIAKKNTIGIQQWKLVK